MKKLLIPLLIVIAIIVAVLVDRSLFWPAPDALDDRIEALQQQLARSQAARDSLDAIVLRQQSALQTLQAEEARLTEVVSSLEQDITFNNREITQLRSNRRRYEVLSSDSILLDLNRIVHFLRDDSSAADSLSR